MNGHEVFRDEVKHLSEPLGASEFAATLNGDNPNGILQALRRFTKTIRRERFIALSADAQVGVDVEDRYISGGEEHEEDDHLNIQPPPPKKLKKTEAWKEDTNAYHVPYVGTAVSKGDISQVIQGQWPTGLLKTYLAKSPLAIEMTGDEWIPSSSSAIHKSLLRRKQTKLSRAIYKAYLKAIAELVTAAVPLDNLRQDLSSSDGNEPEKIVSDGETLIHPFLSALLKKRLVGIFHLINDETDKGRGKPGVYGGCDSMVPIALRVLQNIARTSTTNARLVCRYLDQELSEGGLRAILRPPPPPHSRMGSSDDDQKSSRGLSKPSRLEALRLATILLQTRDSAVTTYICTGGNRERKVRPGILFVAFREGMAKHSQAKHIGEIDDADDYFYSVSDMLKQSRKFIQEPRSSNLAGPKLLIELLSRDPLYHMCDLSAFAPPLTNGRSFQHVLTESEESGDIAAVSCAGQEARRTLFFLLAAPATSPILGDLSSKMHVHSLANVHLRLLQTKNQGVQIRSFILYCLNRCSVLLPELFRVISFPDAKDAFGFMSKLRFASCIMVEGPLPRSCLKMTDEALIQSDHSDIVSALSPVKMQRQAIGKAVQSSNPLVVLESVKFIRNALLRFEALVSSLPERECASRLVATLASGYVQLLPDLQVLLATRSKFDLSSRSKGNDLVYHGIHVVLEQYSKTMPDQILMSQFDWMKLVSDPSSFMGMSTIVQRKALSCLHCILRVLGKKACGHASSLKTIFQIMLRTKDRFVYSKCREIGGILLCSMIGSRLKHKEGWEYGRLEVITWLDALTLSTLDDFSSILSVCVDNDLEVLGRAGKALETIGQASQVNWTILLIASLSEKDVKSEVSDMVLQVASRALVVRRNPIPFASFIVSMKKLVGLDGALGTESGSILIKYAEALLGNRQTSPAKRTARLDILTKNILTSRHDIFTMISALDEDIDKFSCHRSLRSVVELSRFCIHSLLVSGGHSETKETYVSALRRLLPLLLVSHQSEITFLTSQVIDDAFLIGEGSSISVIVTLCMPVSYYGPDGAGSRRSGQVLDLSASLKEKKSRYKILELALTGNLLSPHELIDCQVKLLSKGIGAADVQKNIQLALCIAALVDRKTEKKYDQYSLHLLEEVFDLWWSPNRLMVPSRVECRELVTRLRAFLAGLISYLMRSTSISATFILTLFTRHNKDTVIDWCLGLADSSTDDAEEMHANISILSSLLLCDPLRTVPHFLTHFSNRSFLTCTVWEQGLLDSLVKKIIHHSAVQHAGYSQLAALGRAISSRILSIFEKMTEVKMRGHWLDALDALDLAWHALSLNITSPDGELVDAMCNLLGFVLDDRHLLYKTVLDQVCKVGMALFASNVGSSSLDQGRQSTLSGSLFCVLSELLLTRLKAAPQKNEHNSKLGTVKILQFLTTILNEAGEGLDLKILGRARRSLQHKVCRSALKHGIHGEQGKEIPAVSATSLRYVRTLLEATSQSAPLTNHFVGVAPAEVFSMLLSHSKFTTMITREKRIGSDEIDRVELIRLMHCCVKLTSDAIPVDAATWKLFSVAFDAGLDKFDTAVRSFFQFCSEIGCQNVTLPFLDEIRWSTCPTVLGKEGTRWQWLEEALDINRIRETVAFFPVDDVLSGSEMVDSSVIVGHEDKKGKIDVLEAVGAAKVGISAEPEDANESESPPLSSDCPCKTDTRYSPAFILPRILAALHFCCRSHMVDNKPAIGGGQEIDKRAGVPGLSKSHERFVGMTKRFVEKGVPALCLASLASSCEKIRTIAISILGLILHACNLEEARSLSSWRDRPQITMLLNAVQRAFVLQRARTMEENPSDIPVLSPLISTFLARSSISIAKPDDPMYVPLNRFFLKSDADHGAFQDMNRLPGFIALFCSASDDPLQARKERIWALHHIRDGFQDTSCYRLVSSCHAPELLLSTFENIRLSPFSDEMKSVEYNLLLDILKVFLDKGGRRATSHLIGRIGLLSWVRSICTGRPITNTFSLNSTRVALFKLIASAAKSIMRHSSSFAVNATMLDEIYGLIGPTLVIGTHGDLQKANANSTIIPGVNALVALGNVLRIAEESAHSNVISHHCGSKFPMTMDFLKLVPADMLHLCIPAFCRLPLHLERVQNADAAAFCSFLLTWCRDKAGEWIDDETAKVVLRRVVFLADYFGGDFGTEANGRLCKVLLSSRAKYQGTEDNYLLWIKCLEIVSLRLPDGCVEAQIAMGVLDQT